MAWTLVRSITIDPKEFIRFILTGILGTIGNVTAVAVSRQFISLQLSLLCGLVAGLLISFLVNKIFTFRSKSWTRAHEEAVRFFIVYAAGATLYWVVGMMLTHLLFYRFLPARMAEISGAIFGASTMTFTSYFGHRFFTYRRSRGRSLDMFEAER